MNELVDFERVKSQYVQNVVGSTNEAKELLCLAFMQEVGCKPSECEMVIRYGMDETHVYVRKREMT